jgi:hypothetical protein
MATAEDFGSTGEDNTYGRGFIDAYEAVVIVMNGVGYIRGTVTDAATGEPVPADIEILSTGRATTADPATGAFSLYLPADSTYTVRVTHYGHDTIEQAVYVIPDSLTRLDFAMAPSPTGFLGGMVMDAASGLPVAGATVEILDTPAAAAQTGPLGFFNLGDVPSGATFMVQAEAAGYGPNVEPVDVTPGAINILALPLTRDFADDMEAGEGGWTHAEITPGYSDQWHQSGRRNVTPGGGKSWRCGAWGDGIYWALLDAGLESPEFTLSEGSTLYFWRWIDAEALNPFEAWDGGIVEISIDGGAYQQIFPVGGHLHTILDSRNALPAGTPCYSGTRTWTREEFDLSGLSGAARIRFRFASDEHYGAEGWYIDDLVVAPDPAATPVSILALAGQENIEIGPDGGQFTWQMALVNNTDQEQIVEWWTDVSLSETVVFGPVETGTDTLAPRETRIEPLRTENVPAGAPARTYRFNAKAGAPPDAYDAISSFQFTVTAAGAAPGDVPGEWTLRRSPE